MDSNIGDIFVVLMIGFVIGFLIGGLIIYVALKCCGEDDVLLTPINYEDESGERLFCHYGTGIVYGGGKTEPYSPYRSSDGYLFIYHDGVMQEMK